MASACVLLPAARGIRLADQFDDVRGFRLSAVFDYVTDADAFS
jgi:hypothetical protein